MCGLAPSRVLGSLDYGGRRLGARDRADAADRQGRGRSPAPRPHGQGHETAFSQIVADRLGVAFEDVEVLHGDTQVSAKGLDTYGSRSLVVGGEAVVTRGRQGDREGASRSRRTCSRRRVDDLEFRAGRFTRQGHRPGRWPSPRSRFAVFAAHNLPDGVEPSLDSDATFDPENFSFPHGTHLCAMEVDTETGQLKMRKYVCVDDIGNVINPLIVEGQVHGGLVQGIAQALFEEAVYDDAGTLVTGSFVDYLLPTAADTISFDLDHTVSPCDHEHAGHQGCRRGGHDRLDAGRGQRGRRRGPAVRCATTSRCRARPSGSGRPSKAAGAAPTQRAAMPHFDDAEPGQSSTEGAGQ